MIDDKITKKKKCCKCKKLKLLADFSPCKTGKYGVYNYCIECHKEYENSRNPNRQAIDEQKGLKSQGLKRCRSCSKVYGLAEYFSDPRHKDGKQSHCKLCVSQRLRAHHLEKHFGISADEYFEMLEYQDGVCAICKRPSTKRMLSVDHNHTTHRIRGLLCSNCNTRLLPIVEDHKHWVEEALDYLSAPPASFVLDDKEIPEDSQYRKTKKGAPIISFQH